MVPHRQPPRRIGADILAPERVVAHADEGFRPVKMTPPLQPPPPRCTLRETYLLEITWDDPEDDGGDEVFEWNLPIPPHISPYLPRSPQISLDLPMPPYISLCISLYLPRSSSGPSSARPTSPSGMRRPRRWWRAGAPTRCGTEAQRT